MRAFTLPVLIIAAIVAVAGCGGGDSSSGDAGAAIDDACTTASAALVQIPQKQADEGLSVAQAQALATAAGDQLKRTIASTDVPSDLENTKQQLIDAFDAKKPTTASALQQQTTESGKLYAELGADRCKAYGDAAIKVLQGESVAAAYDGLPLPGVPGVTGN